MRYDDPRIAAFVDILMYCEDRYTWFTGVTASQDGTVTIDQTDRIPEELERGADVLGFTLADGLEDGQSGSIQYAFNPETETRLFCVTTDPFSESGGQSCDGCSSVAERRFLLAGSQDEAQRLLTEPESYNGFCASCITEMVAANLAGKSGEVSGYRLRRESLAREGR